MIEGNRLLRQVRELPPADLVAGVRRSGAYAKGLWVRLNGGGKAGLDDALPLELPKPVSSKVGSLPPWIRRRYSVYSLVLVGASPSSHIQGRVSAFRTGVNWR